MVHAQDLKDVDAVQLQQMKVLRTLVRRHGIKTVLVEGLTGTSVVLFEARVQAFRELKKELEAKPKLPRAAKLMFLELGRAGS